MGVACDMFLLSSFKTDIPRRYPVTAHRNVAWPGSRLDNSMAALSRFVACFELHEASRATHVPEPMNGRNPEKSNEQESTR